MMLARLRSHSRHISIDLATYFIWECPKWHAMQCNALLMTNSRFKSSRHWLFSTHSILLLRHHSLGLLSILEINLSILSKYWLLLRWFHSSRSSVAICSIFFSSLFLSVDMYVCALRFDFICCLWSKSRFVITACTPNCISLLFDFGCYHLVDQYTLPQQNTSPPILSQFILSYQIIDRLRRCEDEARLRG